ncbi:MAG: arylsulfatase [Betaproteobacteria bacterium]
MKTAVWLLALCLCTGVLAADKARPNIVVLVADDWGFSDVGSFGGEISTPHIDSLAAEGMRFSNFHVAASCAPTRSMLLTGVDNHLNGAGNLAETMPREHKGKPGYLGSLNTRVVTVASLLQDSGYRTYIAGKWNVGTEAHNLPNVRGFERSLIQGDTGSDNWEPKQRYLPNSDKVYWFEDGREPVMPAEYYSSEFFVDKMIGYLRAGANEAKPFFAYVGFQANHAPLQAPRSFIDKYKGRNNGGWTVLRKERRDKAAELGLIAKDTAIVTMNSTADWERLSEGDKRYQARRMEVYAAMADAMDYHVGRLIAHLKQSGEYDNTVFVFLSDNGPEAYDYGDLDLQLWLYSEYTRNIDKLGDKGAFDSMGPGWASAAGSPLSGYKFYAGEGGIRTPLIIAGVPGMVKNQIAHGLTHVTDIVPTLLDLASVVHPGSAYKGRAIEALSGHSLLPVMLDPAQRVRAADEVLGYELSGSKALFKGDLKLVNNLMPVGDGQWHLYDLHTDMGETRDLQRQQPDAFKAMQADYEAWSQSHGVLAMPPGYSPTWQVRINSFANYYIPFHGYKLIVGLIAMVAAIVVLRRRRRRA